MKLPISKLNFSLPTDPFAEHKKSMDAATERVRKITNGIGTGGFAYEKSLSKIKIALHQSGDLEGVLESSIDLRAMAFLFNDVDYAIWINLTPSLFQRVDEIRPVPSRLFVDAIYSYYLHQYDRLQFPSTVTLWLKMAKNRRGELSSEVERLLDDNGPKWLAEESQRQGRDFDEQVKHVELDLYRSGRFLMVAKNIYYLNELRQLQPNENHPVLEEMQKPSAYNSRYDESSQLGHQILKILIEKAPMSEVSEIWLNVVLAIAGDPRVPRSHEKHRKWWSQLDSKLANKVQGWLSKLDLQLFLEALGNFSYQAGNEELKRMYPARKQFMTGLLNKQLVTGTRLFLSQDAEHYLKRNYKPEHLPNYSRVDGARSVIHIQLGSVQMIEGSHNCKLWIYERLDPSAIVFDYSKNKVSYHSLTGGLRDQMVMLGVYHKEDITHNPSGFNWQHKAIKALQELGVAIESKDVLMEGDYRNYKRLYGV